MKFKTCDGCGQERTIWKNHEGNRYCRYCWSCHKNTSQKPTAVSIPRVSTKRKKKDEEYSKLRKRFLEENPICRLNLAKCGGHSTDVHHTYAGEKRDSFYLVQSTWLPLCRNCHDWIHGNPKEAREMGWLK